MKSPDDYNEFRAWNKKKKKYSTPKTFECTSLNEELKFIEQEFVLEQYTKLEDRNGKKIFIGDIVMIVDEDFPELIGIRGQVSAPPGYGPTFYGDGKKGIYEYVYSIRTPFTGGMPDDDEIDSDNLVVIGNVNENSKLFNALNK